MGFKGAHSIKIDGKDITKHVIGDIEILDKHVTKFKVDPKIKIPKIGSFSFVWAHQNWIYPNAAFILENDALIVTPKKELTIEYYISK
jgi:hypothetical protein